MAALEKRRWCSLLPFTPGGGTLLTDGFQGQARQTAGMLGAALAWFPAEEPEEPSAWPSVVWLRDCLCADEPLHLPFPSQG